MSPISFATPWILVCVLPLCALMWWWRPRHQHSRWPDMLAITLRMMACIAMVVALANPVYAQRPSAAAVVVVRDVSQSMDATARQQQATYLADLIRTQPADALLGIVDVGANPAVAAIPQLGLADSSFARVDAVQGTALADAVNMAAALVPGEYEGRILVLSDGNETRGRLQDTIDALLARNIRVDVVPLPMTQAPATLAIVDVQIPQRIRGSGVIAGTVMIQSTIPQTAQLVVRDATQELGRQSVSVNAGVQRIPITIPALGAGVHRLSIAISAPIDDQRDDNQTDVLVEQDGPPRVLFLADPLDRAQALIDAWRRIGATVTARRPSDVSTRMTDFATHDVIVLFDTPARRVPVAVMAQIDQSVRILGKGFLWIGGADSYGAGGYRRTPLADLSAVSLDPLDPDKRKELGLLLVIDRSGSMGESDANLSKLDLAKEAAFRAIQQLQQGDTVGVAFFADSAAWALPPQPLPADDEIARGLGSIVSDGGTSIRSGLSLALAQADTLRGDVRHVILLSDGMDTQPSDAIVQQLWQQNITVSTIALGADADVATLKRLADLGHGSAYQVSSARELTNVFLDDTNRVASRDTVEEEVVPQKVTFDPWMAPLQQVVPIFGYNRTSVLRDTRVLVQIDQTTPLWALRSIGRGQSMAWTSDLGGRWGRAWLASDHIAILAPLLLSPLLPTADTGLDMSWFWHDDILEVTVESKVASETPVVRMIDERGQQTTIPLNARGRSRWVGQMRDFASGEYLLVVSHHGVTRTRGVMLTARAELADRNGQALLVDVAQRTGGQIVQRIDAAYWQVTTPQSRAMRDISLWFVLFALCCVVSEIGLRRGVVSSLSRPLWRRPLARPAVAVTVPPPTPVPPVVPSRVDRLRAAKERTRTRDESAE